MRDPSGDIYSFFKDRLNIVSPYYGKMPVLDSRANVNKAPYILLDTLDLEDDITDSYSHSMCTMRIELVYGPYFQTGDEADDIHATSTSLFSALLKDDFTLGFTYTFSVFPYLVSTRNYEEINPEDNRQIYKHKEVIIRFGVTED